MKIHQLEWPDSPCRICPPHPQPRHVHHDHTRAPMHTQGHTSHRVSGPVADLSGNDEFPQRHGGSVFCRYPLEGGDGLFLVPRQHVIPCTLWQPLSGQEAQMGQVRAEQNAGFQPHIHLCVENLRMGALEPEGWLQILALPLRILVV